MHDSKSTSKSVSVWKRWAAFFLLICMLVLIWSIPVSVLPRLLALNSADSSVVPVVQLAHTRGSVWSGQAGRVLINTNQQTLLLENVSWRFNWRSLLAARLCLNISSSPAASATSIGFEGESCFFTSGAIHINNLLVDFPASLLMSAQVNGFAPMRALNNTVQIHGDINGVVENLVWQNGQLLQLRARGLWSDAALVIPLPDAQTLRMRQQPLRLATLPWTAETDAVDQIFLNLSSADNTPGQQTALQINSQSVIWLNGRYTTQLQLAVLPSTPQFLRDMLTIVAEPQGSDRYHLVWSSSGV